MQVKVKDCSRCKKSRVIFKNQKVGEEKFQYCEQCWNILNREKVKEKRKIKREKKRETITEKKLDAIFSKLVREIYPSYCHSSKVPIQVEGSHCAHLISRNNRCVRWDLRNCYPTTPQENMFNQLHVIQLAKRLKEYYGIDIDDWESTAKQEVCKLTLTERKEMYDIFRDGLERTLSLKRSGADKHYFLLLREEIIIKTKKVL